MNLYKMLHEQYLAERKEDYSFVFSDFGSSSSYNGYAAGIMEVPQL